MNISIYALSFLLAAAFFQVTFCRELPSAAAAAQKEKVSIRKRPTLQTSEDQGTSSAAAASQPNISSRSLTNSTVVVLVVSPGSPPSSVSSSSRNASHARHVVADDDDESFGSGILRKQRLIRGSRKAATITRKEYLKKDWCKTEAFQQVVHEQGCVRKRIMNRFCYGQCNSFFIPKSDEDDQDGGSFRSCAYCMPIDSEWVDVVLHCPKKTPSRIVKKVQIVSNCKCMAVNLESGLLDSLKK